MNSWLLTEINECGKGVRLCMEDGRLIYGMANGFVKSNIPGGLLRFISEGKEMYLMHEDIADFVVA